jgi:hypothetical protein
LGGKGNNFHSNFGSCSGSNIIFGFGSDLAIISDPNRFRSGSTTVAIKHGSDVKTVAL